VSEITLGTNNTEAARALRVLADRLDRGEVVAERISIYAGEYLITPLELESMRVLPIGGVAVILRGRVESEAYRER
jgi:hypothetical protein